MAVISTHGSSTERKMGKLQFDFQWDSSDCVRFWYTMKDLSIAYLSIKKPLQMSIIRISSQDMLVINEQQYKK